MASHPQQRSSQIKMAWTLLLLQLAIAVLYFLLVRYDDSADARHVQNRQGKEPALKRVLDRYPSKRHP